MTKDLWYYLKSQAETRNARFLRYGGEVYEVSKQCFTNGPSPLWSVEEVRAVDVPLLQEQRR